MFSYAEIHYRPRFFPSGYYQPRPEILFDAPWRIEPERPVPIFLIIRDSYRFPVEIDHAAVRIVHESGSIRTLLFPYGGLRVETPIWWDSFSFMPERLGRYTIHPSLAFRREGKSFTVQTDNYRPHPGPLLVHVSPTALPSARGWYHGDIHCHTEFTADQIEFGAPLEVTAYAAFCAGMSWIGATDHSYDLDDLPGDYLANDPSLGKWRAMTAKAAVLNDSLAGIAVIAGEEVTCRTRKGRNGHMLALGAEKFIPGSGDSGERGLPYASERSVSEAAAECIEWGGIACAAHPFESVSLAERLFLRRGAWEREDLETPGLGAVQFHNGVRDGGFRRGMKAWIDLLLRGRRTAAFGGGDSHGDMNRRRGIGFPFLTVRESPHHTLGSVRTVVRAVSGSAKDILEALRGGKALVTEGPFIDLSLRSGDAEAGPGDVIHGGRITVASTCLSTPEFGRLRRGRILGGKKGDRAERVLADLSGAFSSLYRHEFEGTFSLHDCLYVRAESETDDGRLCFTNPVWIET